MENGYEKAKLSVPDDDLRNADHDLSLKSLSEKDLIHDVGYVRTGKTYSRKFAPKVSRAEYLAMQVMNELPDQELPEFLEFFQGKVG